MQLLTQALSMLTRGRDPEQDARLAAMAKRRLAIAALPLGLALVARGLCALDRGVAERVAQLGELEQILAAAAAGAPDPSPAGADASRPSGSAAGSSEPAGDGSSDYASDVDQDDGTAAADHVAIFDGPPRDPWAHLTPAPLQDISAP
jgi:hypothetical protein